VITGIIFGRYWTSKIGSIEIIRGVRGTMMVAIFLVPDCADGREFIPF
jgi:hypothetical protein